MKLGGIIRVKQHALGEKGVKFTGFITTIKNYFIFGHFLNSSILELNFKK